MAERCGLRRLPKDILESGIDRAVWEPYIPNACLRCLRKALNNSDVARQLVHDSTVAADDELKEMGIDPELVDRDHGIGIKLADGATRLGIEDSGIDLNGEQGGWRTYIEECEFTCLVEDYELTSTDKRFLQAVLAPDFAYRPDGKEDGLVHYFYRKAEAEPEAFLAIIAAAKDFMLHDEDGVVAMEEINELRIDRLLSMVADIPSETEWLTVDPPIKADAWEIILHAEWLHYAASPLSLKRAVERAVSKDPRFVLQLRMLIEKALNHATTKFKEHTGYDQKATSLINERHDPKILSYVMDTYPKIMPCYKSITDLYDIWQQINRIQVA
jgi:hypothetical protein